MTDNKCNGVKSFDIEIVSTRPSVYTLSGTELASRCV